MIGRTSVFRPMNVSQIESHEEGTHLKQICIHLVVGFTEIGQGWLSEENILRCMNSYPLTTFIPVNEHLLVAYEKAGSKRTQLELKR